MTPQQIEAMKLALEALKKCHYYMIDAGLPNQSLLNEAFTAYKAIEEALAQPKQEPFCLHWEDRWGCNHYADPKEPHPVNAKPLYTTKPQRTEQEPVAWMDADGNVSDNNDHKCFPIPLYTTPPQRTWVDVPDEEIKILWIQYRAALPRYLCFAKDLLSIAKEKNI